MRARIRDTEIFFDVDGAGLVAEGTQVRERPTVFVVPGGPGVDHVGAKARYEPLTRKAQIVFFDHRGHGRSARGDSASYTLDNNVEDMEALRQYLGLGPIVSIGNSYGGIVAMAHAARYPASVSHLIVGATVAHKGYVARAKQLVAERGTAEQITQCNELFAGRLDTAEKMRGYFEVMGSLYSRRHDAQSGVGLGPTTLTPEALNRAHGPDGFLRAFDLRPELASITARTLILAGRYDWIAPPEFAEEIYRFIPNSDLRIFEDSGHTISRDEPQRYIDVIAGFLVYNTKMAAH